MHTKVLFDTLLLNDVHRSPVCASVGVPREENLREMRLTRRLPPVPSQDRRASLSKLSIVQLCVDSFHDSLI